MVLLPATQTAPILLAAYTPAVHSHAQWPSDLATFRNVGATAITARIAWGVPTTTVLAFAKLCEQLGLGLVIDLGCLAQPPLALLRQHASAVLRNTTGQSLLSPDGQLQAIMLHPALRSHARAWLIELTTALRQAASLLAFFVEAPDSVLQELQRWQQADTWPAVVYSALPTLSLANGWPFQQQLWHTLSASTNSAIRGLALLSHIAGSDLADATPPESSDDMRAAWADAAGVSIQLRHYGATTYLSIQRTTATPYSGVLTYRNAIGELLHVHVNLGPQRSGVVLLHDEEIIGAAFDGDASEGVWLLRAMRSSIVFNGGTGAVVPCGTGLLLLANQSGRFQIRRPSPWESFLAYRLTQHGDLMLVPCQVEAAHLTVPYISEDSSGATDCYAILAADAPITQPFLGCLVLRLITRAEILRSIGHAELKRVALMLDTQADQLQYPQQYITAWDEQRQVLHTTSSQLATHYAQLRSVRLLTGDDPASAEELQLEHLLSVLNAILRVTYD